MKLKCKYTFITLLGYFALFNALIGLGFAFVFSFVFSGQVVQILNKEKHDLSRWKEAVDGVDAEGERNK